LHEDINRAVSLHFSLNSSVQKLNASRILFSSMQPSQKKKLDLCLSLSYLHGKELNTFKMNNLKRKRQNDSKKVGLVDLIWKHVQDRSIIWIDLGFFLDRTIPFLRENRIPTPMQT
jgi:hypothetical protein